MPVYNRENYIADAIRSVLMQTYKNFELIIFDDGSSDSSNRIVMDFASKDKRIKYIMNAKNHGVPYARNALIRETKTDLACWQDSDDMSNIHRLQILSSFLQRTDRNMIFSTYRVYYAEDYPECVIDSGMFRRDPTDKKGEKLGFATMMFRVNKSIRFNESKKFGGEDHDWIKRMRGHFLESPTILKNTLYYIRFHDDRIGMWKRRLRPHLESARKKNLSYEETIRLYGQ